MGRWYLSPRWLSVHLLVLVAVLACAGLGRWQLDRSRELHAASQRPLPDGPARPLARVLPDGARVGEDDFARLVVATGRYDTAHQLLVPRQGPQGRQGFLVVAPLRPATGDPVIVGRGWMPAPAQGGAPRPPAAPGGEVTVTGWLAPADPLPEGDAGTGPGEVAAVNRAALVNVLPYAVRDGYLQLVRSSPADDALTATARPVRRSAGAWPLQNLSYVVEWWVFGGAAVWLWVAMVRNEAQARRRTASATRARLADDVDVRPASPRR